jgi:hypothetical protein
VVLLLFVTFFDVLHAHVRSAPASAEANVNGEHAVKPSVNYYAYVLSNFAF